jgi:NADPH:quinone reductase-like Zn-dependent oxidoreductase
MATMTKTTTMKAARIHAFGGPEVLRVEEVPVPEPQVEQILVHVRAAGVNPVDWKIREGQLGKIPLPSIMGSDFSGVIEALGPKVEEFRVGQPVFGTVADESGSYSDFALAPTSQVAEKPAALDHETAAALPIAGLTAWQALFDKAELQPGQKVLIHAAAGGVGSLAVQFARWKGARVLGTASDQHVDFVRELGAHDVIDYKKQRFEESVRDIDVVVDTIGGETQERSWKVLKPGGVMVSIVQPPSKEAATAHHARGVLLRCDVTRSDELAQIGELVASGDIKIHISTELPLEQARQAQELSQGGHTQGKIVLKVS